MRKILSFLTIIFSFNSFSNEVNLDQFHIYLGKNLSNSLEMNEVSFEDLPGYTANYEYELDSLGLSIGGEYLRNISPEGNIKLPNSKMGELFISFGINFEIEREGDKLTISLSNGESGSYSSSQVKNLKIQPIHIFSNIQLLIEKQFSLILGLAYSDLQLKNSGAVNTWMTDSKILFQYGLGYTYLNTYRLQFTGRKGSYDFKGTSTELGNITGGEVDYSQYLLTLGYIF